MQTMTKSVILIALVVITLTICAGCTNPNGSTQTTSNQVKSIIVTPTVTSNPWVDYDPSVDSPKHDIVMILIHAKANATYCIVRLLGGYDLSNHNFITDPKEISYSIDCNWSSPCKYIPLFSGNEITKGSTKIITNPTGWNGKRLLILVERKDGSKIIFFDHTFVDEPFNDYEMNIVKTYGS
jgi:hypothetical protein